MVSTGSNASNHERLKTIVLGLVIVLGMTSAAILVRWTDQLRPPVDPNLAEESLYLNDKTARRISLGFNGLAADWYWMRSLQYVGKKVLNHQSDLALDDLSELNMKLLAPLLDTATSLDPEFIEPYEFAAIVLPAVDVEQAIRLTQKGIDANPNAWRLYHHLGYIYWRQGKYQLASETYARGAQIPGAPAWMEAMRAKMAAEGGSRSTAREIYTRMYEQSSEDQVREMARKHLMRLDSLDQRDGLQKLFTAYKTRTGKCPDSWRELTPVFRAVGIPMDQSGAPLDPSGAPYILKAGACDVELDWRTTKVPLK
jgi:tetratricopeptide (TPR) repeat protein